MRFLRHTSVLVALLFLLGELLLRAWGMRNYPLYYSDARYEYFTRPEQDVRMGRIRFTTNALGMRSPPIGLKRGRRILVIGDSVINGGYQTTQDGLATTIVVREWPADELPATEFINLSAASWGPDNAAAFLAAHGLFDADQIVAVFSSHDAFDRMTFEPLVGVHPSYPERKPLLAWAMFIRKLRYAWGGYAQRPKARLFNPGWHELRRTAEHAGIPLVLLLHPEKHEIRAGRYDDRGRMLIDSLRSWSVPVIELLPGMDTTLYTDRIHLNEQGQRRLAEHLRVASKAGRPN